MLNIDIENVSLHEKKLKDINIKNAFCEHGDKVISLLGTAETVVKNPIVKLILHIAAALVKAIKEKVCVEE